MTDLKRQPPLPHEPSDPLAEALASLRRLPEGQRYDRGNEHLRAIIELVLRQPARAAVIEEAAALCGKSFVEADEIRTAVERAAIDFRPVTPTEREIVRVLTDPDVVLRMRGSGPRVVSDYNPFSNERIRGG
jgi:hypothetical protein